MSLARATDDKRVSAPARRKRRRRGALAVRPAGSGLRVKMGGQV